VLRWGGKDLDFGVKWDAGDAYSAYYLCEQCHGVVRDFHKERMNAEGKWIATAVARDPRHRGFGELSQLYHPDIMFHELVRDFLKVKAAPEQLQVWVNDRMGECWEDKGDGMDEDGLLGRRENYGVPVMLDGVQYNTTPPDVAVLTASADVGENHLAVTVCGWGKDEECWVLEYTMFEGDTLQPEVWEAMLAYLKRPWLHPSGLKLSPKCVPVDSGFRDEMVSAFVRSQARGNFNIIAIKGDEKTRAGKIMSDLPSKKNKHKVHIYIVNATRTKTSVFGRLKIKTGSPASIHFPVTVDAEYFKGLLSERWVSVMQQGQRVRRLLKKPGVRNEPLDTMGYNIAALEWLKNHRRFDLNNEAAQMRARVDAEEQRRMTAGELTPTEYYQERVKKLQENEQQKRGGRRIISKGVV
jgi:phage terminase large subunit GpA-like protein